MKATLKYALIIGSVSIIWKLIIFNFGMQHEVVPKFIPLLFILIGVFFGMREENFNLYNSLNLKGSINSGVKISAINALLYGAFVFIYYSWIDAGYFARDISEKSKLLKLNGNTPEQILEYIQTSKMIFTPVNLFSFTLFGYLFIGAIYATVCGLLLYKIPALAKTR